MDHLAITFTHGLSMSCILQPWQLLLMILASWVHREQQKVIEFYRTEVEALTATPTSAAPSGRF